MMGKIILVPKGRKSPEPSEFFTSVIILQHPRGGTIADKQKRYSWFRQPTDIAR